jgi:hypothetical protein
VWLFTTNASYYSAHATKRQVGATLSIPIVGQQSVKFVCSPGTRTPEGSDFNSFNATWQLQIF